MSRILLIKTILLTLLAFQQTVQGQDARFRTPLSSSTVACTFNTTNCYAKGKYHTGVDYYSSNRDILATNAGRIVVIQPDDTSPNNNDHNMGNTVIIEHSIINAQGAPEIIYSQYSHLQSFIPGLYVGENVVKGQKIGTMGSTGGNWEVHLHFEIKRSPTLGSQPAGYWGYTPTSAVNYGYIDPIWLINSGTIGNGNNYASWDFKGPTNREGWELKNIEGWSVHNDILFQDPQAVDPYIVSPDLFVDASVLKFVNLTIANNGLDGNLSIYFKTAGDADYHPNKIFDYRISFCEPCGNAPFKTYKIPIYQNLAWTGKITGIRIDPTTKGVNGSNVDTIGYERIWLSAN